MNNTATDIFYWEDKYETWVQQKITYQQVFTNAMILIASLLVIAVGILWIFYILTRSNPDISSTALIIPTLLLYMSITVFTLDQVANYEHYLDSNIEKYTYKTTSLSGDKKTIYTKYGTFDNNNPKPIKTIEIPTTDKAKAGKTYYKVTVYRPQNIAKLTDKVNTLVEYKYIYSTPPDK